MFDLINVASLNCSLYKDKRIDSGRHAAREMNLKKN